MLASDIYAKSPQLMKSDSLELSAIMPSSPLTLDELNKIKGTVDGTSGMLPVLRGIYHIRVEYPDDAKNPK